MAPGAGVGGRPLSWHRAASLFDHVRVTRSAILVVRAGQLPNYGHESDRNPVNVDRRKIVMPTATNEEAFSRDVLQSPVPVVLLLFSTSSALGRQMVSYLDNISLRLGTTKVRILQMDVDENPEQARKLSVTLGPATLIFLGGRWTSTKNGVVPEAELETWIKSVMR